MFLLIDKPKGITSHDVVKKIREITDERKVGHAGTLDPAAGGLLIIGMGRNSTKKLHIFLKDKKTYEAVIYLGEERDTLDREGVVIRRVKSFLPPTEKQIKPILLNFKGEKHQIPPDYSAIKIKGKKAYELARKNKKFSLKPRKVVIYSIKLMSYKYPYLKISTTVSGGTYIRSLARDIGENIGCGAYLNDLKRTKIGKYKLESAVPLYKLNKENWKKHAIDV